MFITTVKRLRFQGFRLGRVRQGMLKVFIKAHSPLSMKSMVLHLKKQGIVANKTSLYREIDFLKSQHLIQEFQLKGLEKCYEWKREHHHHLVCRRCSAVEEIQLKELELVMPLVQKHLEYKTRFSGIEHALEFFGVCGKCSHPSPR